MSDFKYNAFISYSHQDKDWVRKKLLPCLEIAGLNICIDYRDFEIGAPSIINMENAIQYSHKTILVLTPQWIKSEWSKFEALLYQTDDPTNRWRRLLPILIEPCELPPRLKMLTYLDLTEISSTEYGEESQITRLINAIREGNSPLLIRGDASLTKGELRVLQDTNSIITQQDNLPPKTQFPPKTQEVKDLISNLQDSTAPDVSLQITTQVVDTDSHLSGSSSFEQKKSKDSTLTDKMDSLVLSYTYKQFSNNQHADQFSRTFEEHQKHIQEASQFLEHLNYQMHKGHQKVAGEEPRETSDESIMALGHIHLILSTRVQQILVEQRKSIPYLPDLARMSQDIHILNQKKGIPAVIIVGKGMNTARLRLYTSSYSIDLYTSHHQDGYSISSINVLTLHDHERMTQGVLWLRATEWTICTDFREISSDSSNNWQQISDAWFQLLSRQANLKTQRAGWQSKNITFEQQHYLDAISVAIEITRQLELDRDRLALGIIYNKVEFIG